MLYDKDIREPLFDFLEAYYGKIRILEEKQMGRSRADIVMVLPSSVVGIEIKSDADTYARLQRQVKDYNQYFDYNYVVAGSSHAMHIEEHVPEWWGIITVEQVDGEADFYISAIRCAFCRLFTGEGSKRGCAPARRMSLRLPGLEKRRRRFIRGMRKK